MKKHTLPFFTFVILGLFSLLFITPLFFLFVQACIPVEDASLVAQGVSPLKLWPSPFSLNQFSTLFFAFEDYWRRYFHDLIWCVTVSLIQVFISIIDGYILAKYKNIYVSILTVIFTLTMIVPMQMFLIPAYRFTQKFGVVNQSISLYLPLAFTPIGTILMRQINLKLPNERIEYLRMEGGEFHELLFFVIFPHCKPSALILFLLSFVDGWGMVEQPLILLTNKMTYPISMLLYDMRVYHPQIIYAASIVSLLPILVSFLILLCTFIF